MSTSPIPLTEAQMAEHAARMQFLQQQALDLMNTVRLLKIRLVLADQAGELSEQLKEHLYGELLHCAGVVEAKR